MKNSTLVVALILSLIYSSQSYAQAPLSTDTHEGKKISQGLHLINSLTSRSFKEKSNAIDGLAKIKNPKILPIFKAMLDGSLYFRKSDKFIVFSESVGTGKRISDVVSGEELGIVGSREIKKITINNKLRKQLRAAIAVLELGAESLSLRLNSARNLLKTQNPDLLEDLKQAAAIETNGRVKSLLEISIAQINIDTGLPLMRLNAVETLGATVEPEAVVTLRKLAEKHEDGSYLERDLKVAELAEKKLRTIDTKLFFYRSTENLFFGLSLGSVFLLAAIGLAITFGVMGVINMAHGEIIMIGAYTTFAVQQIFPSAIELSLLIALPAAFLVSGFVGVVIERLVIRHLYGRPLDTLLATFGVGLILQQTARSYNSNNVPVITPSWMSAAWAPNGAISFNYNRLYIVVFSIVVLLSLALLLKKTLFGLQMRAVTQNRPMASSMGIKQNWIDAMTFGLGSGIAGIAGVALSQITNVGPNLGSAYIVDSFMVVVFGGVGSLVGTFTGALGLGVINKILEPSAGAVIGKIIVLIFIILFIQWRPRGLFALKGRFVED